MKIYTFTYVTNLININKAKKSAYVDLRFNKKVITIINFFISLRYLSHYELITVNKRIYIRAYLNYYNNSPIGINFKLINKPSQRIYSSVESLKLISKRTGGSIFLLSTDKGLLTHIDALKLQLGGIVIGFFTF